jgi:ATP-dependent DNA helicase RecQ
LDGDAAAGQIAAIARDRFGFAALRPGQREAIEAVLAGQDTLAVLPTGAGKSAIYQIAGLIRPGATVVISPLLALQYDQVTAIEELQAGGAAAINSIARAAERRETWAGLAGDDLEFLFLAPEQFASEEVLERLQAARLSLVVVDEAHCVSQWGHDFRPDYLRLGAVIEGLGHPTVLALTATAAPPVRTEIIERLGLRRPVVIVRGFDRPNIRLGVERHDDEAAKLRALVERVAATEGAGIVYAATRRQAEEVATALNEAGVVAAVYHAGRPGGERTEVQDRFMAGALPVVVATTAFGMGIDKPDVRFVFHYAISESVDSYYQEIGRAGRDGEPARALLFYRPADLGLRRFFAGAGRLDEEELQEVVAAVNALDSPAAIQAIQAATGLSETKLATALQRLDDAGAVVLAPDGTVRPAAAAVEDEAAVAAAVEAQEQHRQVERSRTEMMRGYAETAGCRRAYLLTYFGEVFAGPCGACDNCQAGRVSQSAASARPFPLTSLVHHAAWGEGQVIRYEEDKIVVLFETAGYKTLAVDLVIEQGLLRPATA